MILPEAPWHVFPNQTEECALPEIAGVIHSNTGDMVRELCTMLLGQIENSGSVPESRLFPTVFRPAGSPEFEALKTRHFQLT